MTDTKYFPYTKRELVDKLNEIVKSRGIDEKIKIEDLKTPLGITDAMTLWQKERSIPDYDGEDVYLIQLDKNVEDRAYNSIYGILKDELGYYYVIKEGDS